VSDPKRPDDPNEDDDWGAAVDEWDANLAFGDEKKPEPEPEPVAAAPIASDEKTPVPGDGPDVRTPVPGEGPKLAEPPGLPEPPSVPPEDDDPLLHLFDGEMALPDAAGEALGPMLGDPPDPAMEFTPASADPPLPAELADLELDWDGEGPTNDHVKESLTPVLQPMERQGLLDLDAEGAAFEEENQPVMAPNLDAGYDDDEVEVVVVKDSTDAPTTPAPKAAAELPRPRAAPETLERFRRQLEETEDEPPTTPLPTVKPAPKPQPVVAAPPPDDEDDDYADISIDQSAASADEYEPQPASRPVSAPVSAKEESLHISIAEEKAVAPPLSEDTIVMQSAPFVAPATTKVSEPTMELDPFDVLDQTAAAILPQGDPLGGLRSEPALPVVSVDEPDAAPPPSKLPSGLAPLALKVPESVDPKSRPLEEGYHRTLLELLDGERFLCQEAERSAELSYAAGRAAERGGDRGEARARYEAALDASPGSAMALRALRRLAIADRKLDEAQSFLEREAERVSDGERPGLVALRAELLLAGGEREAARGLLRDAAAAGDLRALSGMVDATCGDGPSDDSAAAIAVFADRVKEAHLVATLRAEVARIAEAGGTDAVAAAGYRRAIEADPQCRAAVSGLLRIALRGGNAEDLAAACGIYAPLVGGAAAVAVVRRYAEARIEAGDPASAADALTGAVDRPSIALRARAESRAGRDAQAVASLEQVSSLIGDGAARANVLLAVGELHEKAGAYDQARDAYQRALDGNPADIPAALGIERIDRASGDGNRLVERARAAAADPALAETMRLRAARMLVGLGRTDEAIAELDAALALAPPSLAALTDRVELALAAGRPADAAQALSRVARTATEAGDGETAMLLSERAARLFARAGETAAAIDEDRLLLESDLGATARRHLVRLLAAAPGREAELAEALSVEAETTPDRARAANLWFQRGLVLEGRELENAVESQRRALALSPGHSPSLLALALRATDRADLVTPLRARLEEAAGRAEVAALQLRLASLHEELSDPAATAQSYADALAALPTGEKRNEAAARALSELLASAARRSGDTARAVDLEAKFVDGETDPDERFARHLRLAEQYELRLSRTDAAAEHYGKALELRPQSPLALPGLVRAYKAAGRFAVLAEMALHDLKEATDVARRVAAYEQLAILDGEHRGDPQSALMSYASITQVDHTNHFAFRQLEKSFLKEQSWPELVVLYDQIGLTATDPLLATAVILDRARLRELLGGQEDNVDNDFRQALFKNSRCRPALRRVLATARVTRDPSLTAELCLRLADSPDVDPMGAAVLLQRAAEALNEMARTDESLAKLTDAVARDPGHLPSARALTRLGIENGSWASAVAGAEAAGRVLHDVAERTRSWLAAGAMAQDQLGDDARALTAFREVLQIEPKHLEAFQRVRALLDKSGHAGALAQALATRVEVETDPARLLALHLELATLHRDRLSDREQAKVHLRKVLAAEANHVPALTALSDLYYGDGQWAEAADALIRRARVEKTPQVLRDVFFKLGLIYSDHLPDAKRAVVSFTRVLQIEPDNRVALEYLSNLSVKEREWKGALGATQRLAELESDPVKKVGWLHRAAKIHEEGFKDARNAHDALRRALDVDLRYLPAIGELAKFYDRQGDATSARVHLDRSAQAMRAVLARDPNDLASLHGLFRVFSWRRSIDQAFTVAALLNARGAADEEEKTLLARFANKDFSPGSALGDPSLDEQLFHAMIPPGFRHLFRLLDDALQKAFRSDLRRLGVGKNERLPKAGHTVRDIANRIAADMGVRDFDLYITAALPNAVAIELTEPVAIIVGNKLIEGAHEKEVIFHLAGALRMLRSQMAVALRMNADELGILVGGIVRQFVPDFVPKGFDEALIAAEAGKLAKVVPKKLHQELLPFALECADPGLDLRTLSQALGFTQARAGLLACGSIAHAVAALRKRGDEAQSRELLRFAVADDLADLRRAVGTAIG
jgi:tetratricopeptide (TPR) repeat protein